MPQSLVTSGILVLPAFAADTGTTVTREALSSLWAEALGMASDEVLSDRDLNDFGATALDSVRVAARLRDRFGVTVGPADLAARPTVDDQLAMLKGRAWSIRRRGTLQ